VLCLTENLLYKELGVATTSQVFKAEQVSYTNDWERDKGGGPYASRISARFGPEVLGGLELYKREILEPAIRNAAIASREQFSAKFSPRQPTAGTEVGGLPGRGDVSGGAVELAASRDAFAQTDTGRALKGLPTRVIIPGQDDGTAAIAL
jgi:hypothetical protein